LKLPDLEERSRSDLTERGIFAVERILEKAPPGGRLLELGCASGSLLFLLREAGFEVQGLEMNAYVADFAGDRFGVSVSIGTVEKTSADESWDVIVAIDVLEHLMNPLETMTVCRRRLSKAGVLFLQTPWYREEGVDWPMFLPAEHLHLFTEESVRSLLETAGFGWMEVRESLFPYDMWIVAAASEPPFVSSGRLSSGSGEATPVLLALKDARKRLEAADRRIADLELDRRAHRELASEAGAELLEVRADQSSKSALIDRMSEEIVELRADQSAKAEVIENLARESTALREDQSAKASLIERITGESTELREDQSAKAALIERITGEATELRQDQAAKEELIERLDRDLMAIRDDQREKQNAIERTSAELTEARDELDRTGRDLARLRGRWSVRVGTRLRRALGGKE